MSREDNRRVEGGKLEIGLDLRLIAEFQLMFKPVLKASQELTELQAKKGDDKENLDSGIDVF